jgi:hypothetical protein
MSSKFVYVICIRTTATLRSDVVNQARKRCHWQHFAGRSLRPSELERFRLRQETGALGLSFHLRLSMDALRIGPCQKVVS